VPPRRALIKLSIWPYHITVISKFLFFSLPHTLSLTHPSLSLFISLSPLSLSLSHTHTLHPCVHSAGTERLYYNTAQSTLHYRWGQLGILLRRCSANKKCTPSDRRRKTKDRVLCKCQHEQYTSHRGYIAYRRYR